MLSEVVAAGGDQAYHHASGYAGSILLDLDDALGGVHYLSLTNKPILDKKYQDGVAM